MSLITVSRQAGSLGDETARILASVFDYPLLAKDTLEKTFGDATFPDIPLEKYDEHSPSFWENFSSGKDVYLDRLRTAMLETAKSGKAVILGRGGQYIFRGLEGAFHVRLIATTDVRFRRIGEMLSCDRKTAEKYCRKTDHDRSGFARFFFGAGWGDPGCYDLIVNTDRLDPEQAAGLVEGAYRASPAVDKDDTDALGDRLLAQRVRNRILYEKRIPVDLLEVEATGGRISVKGTVTVKENADRCEEAAREIDGVADVEIEVYFVNPVMTY